MTQVKTLLVFIAFLCCNIVGAQEVAITLYKGNNDGERIGFNPELFKKNIEYIRTNFPHIRISISTTNTINNIEEITEIKKFSSDLGCSFTNVVLNPCKSSDIELMPPITEFFENSADLPEFSNDKSCSCLQGKKTRCGAAKNTCSIDPVGNVYPCQSLHFKDFFMGNLLKQEIKELRYQDEEECTPSIDEISECAKCKLKYMCGGGCLASAYELRGNKLGYNKWLCPYNYQIAMNTLLHIKNNPLIKDTE